MKIYANNNLHKHNLFLQLRLSQRAKYTGYIYRWKPFGWCFD